MLDATTAIKGVNFFRKGLFDGQKVALEQFIDLLN